MSTVPIGQAASLYGIKPSTLRWWERQGLIGTPQRDGDRRRYLATHLRRVGAAYLCRTVGMMSLDKAAVVTSGRADLDTWRQAVRAEIAGLDQRIDRMRASRDYLQHLLRCEHDDVTECHYLDRDLVAHTPRGRFPTPDIVAAARMSGSDEITCPRDESVCASCRSPLARGTRGRPRTYCSRACRQRAYRVRQRTATPWAVTR